MAPNQQLVDDVGDIKDCLIGNALKNQKGLVNTVNDLDKTVNKLDDRLAKLENKMHNRKSISFKLPAWIIKFLG